MSDLQIMGVDRKIQIDRRAMAKRSRVRITVRVRRPGESWVSSVIADLSLTGFRLQSFMKLKSGSELWIMLPGFEGRRAIVLWTRAHEAGCAFERALHPAILDHVIARYGGAKPDDA